MLFLSRNEELITNREFTYLTSPVAVGATTLTVRAVDSNAWANNDWIIIGEINSKNAEIMQIAAAVSDGTSLTIDNAGSGGTRYAHAVDEPVYRIDYNRVEFTRAETETSAKTVLNSPSPFSEIQPDDFYTRYEDTQNSTGFGFVRFYNSQTGGFSSYSDGIPYTGYTAKSLGRMQRMVRRRLGEQHEEVRHITDEEIAEELNEKQRDIAHERLWPFYEDTFSMSTVAYQRNYDISDEVVIAKPHVITVHSQPLVVLDANRFDILFWDSSTTGDPSHVSIWNNQMRLWPVPATAAQTTTLNGALSATATTITVTSTSGFSPSGRFIVDSEVISYTNTTSTQFLGCVRGEEETTAATHLTAATVTERDIVFTANREPNELVDVQDETLVPDPDVLVDGVAMDLAIGRLENQTLHDRFQAKYERGLERLRDKFGKKASGSNLRILDKDEIINDRLSFRNPNDYPSSIGT